MKKIILFSMAAILLTACITVEVDTQSPEAAQPSFVTATLAPTQPGFVPVVITPTLEATLESTLAPTLNVTAPANCKDSAVLLRDVTIPDNTQVKAGEKFTKTWEFMNNGKCPWTGYTIVFAAGDKMNAPLSAPVPDTLPGNKVEVSVELTAPTSNGTYTSYFTLNDASGKNLPIGIEKTFWVKIVVGNGTVPQATQSTTTGGGSTYVPPSGNSNCAYTRNDGYVQELIGLINQARTNAKLKPLTANSQLMAAAQAHSTDMACNNFLDHTSSDGSWIDDRLRAAGYAYSYFEEIIAIGTPQNAMDQWAADAPHWQSVLNPSVTEIGVGYAYYAKSDFGGYITVDFGDQ